MNIYFLYTVALLILLGGCAPKVWHKDSTIQKDYERDVAACERKASEGGWGTRNLFNLCMASKGYSLIRK